MIDFPRKVRAKLAQPYPVVVGRQDERSAARANQVRRLDAALVVQQRRPAAQVRAHDGVPRVADQSRDAQSFETEL
eukprot:4915363-Prymnesium_polylepis.1